jgi:hypothetical protein
MSDELYDGWRIRLLTIVDNHTRESLAIYVGQRIRGRLLILESYMVPRALALSRIPGQMPAIGGVIVHESPSARAFVRPVICCCRTTMQAR